MKLSDQLTPLMEKDQSKVPGWLAQQWYNEAKRLEEIEQDRSNEGKRIMGFSEGRGK